MNLLYCPYCKEDLVKNNLEYSCKNNHIIYINPAPTVSVVPIKDGKVLLSKRAIEPYIGSIDILGGFVNVGETTSEAAVREVFEETGLKVKIRKSLGEYTEMNYNLGVTYPLAFIYIVDVIEGELKAMDDVSELFWVDIDDIEKLDFSGSFSTVKETLLKFKSIIKQDG